MAEIKRLARLLDEFRSLSRADETTFERCDLFEVGEYAAGHLATLARAANISIRRDFPAEPVLVEGHPDKLRQVAINLAKNGIEAMPEGGTLTISLQAGPDLALLMVGDTGAGIPEGVDILQPFRTTKASGTGLGLAIVKQIVVSHHGSIAWESTPGEGTKFKVTLPLARS